MKIFFKILLLALVVTSCSDVEPTVFNGEDTSNPTFLSFSNVKYTLPIERDASGAVNVIVNASTLSPNARTYRVDVVLDENNPANPATYFVPTEVTIPANEYSGILAITGTDGGLVDGTAKSFFVKLHDEDVASVYMDSNLVEVSVLEACITDGPFMGMYDIEQITSQFAGPAFSEGLVELKAGNSPIERKFTVDNMYPDYNVPGQTIGIIFTCDGATITDEINSGIGCTSGINIIFAPSSTPGAYDAENDSEFYLTFTENATSTCNTGPQQTTYKFTKVE